MKYDWRIKGKSLTVVGGKKSDSKNDVILDQRTLCIMYALDLLTGQALEDAKAQCN